MKTTRLKIDGMNCLTCLAHVEKALEAVPGVQDVTADLDQGAIVEHDGVDETLLLRAIAAAGNYRAEVVR